MQGTPMNKNRPMRQASGGTWRAYSAQILLIWGWRKENLYLLYNDMAAILNFLTSLMLFIIYT